MGFLIKQTSNQCEEICVSLSQVSPICTLPSVLSPCQPEMSSLRCHCCVITPFPPVGQVQAINTACLKRWAAGQAREQANWPTALTPQMLTAMKGDFTCADSKCNDLIAHWLTSAFLAGINPKQLKAHFSSLATNTAPRTFLWENWSLFFWSFPALYQKLNLKKGGQ